MVVKINTTKRVVPMIYSYSTPQIVEHNGWTKIGYTEQDVDTRIKQQTHTANIQFRKEWAGNAIFDDGSGDRFTDKDFHAYLRKEGIENTPRTEWFHIDGPNGELKFHDFRKNRGILAALSTIPYQLRQEQENAVAQTEAYQKQHSGGEFLWNAKPRFGKTLSVYDFCKKVQARNVLIVTNRPAIANSWYSDYAQFLGDFSGYKFVSETEALKGKPYVLTREEWLIYSKNHPDGLIEFVSLQDLKGSIYFGGKYDKLKEVGETIWDLLVIDEAHEGVDTLKTDTAFDRIQRNFTLHLSGTPFKAIANDKFPEEAIFNWTYADEQKAKRSWSDEDELNNPYADLPTLNLFTYQMSEIVQEEINKGIEIGGTMAEYAFDLNEFFEAKNGKFVYEQSVDRFLDALTQQSKFPFSTNELRNELKHTFWLLNRVESAKALAKKLKEHPVFKDYEIVLAAGDGQLDDMEETGKSYDRVCRAIKEKEKTITLSVGQLTTGITIPEWTGVLMLSNIKSPSLYMQAAFRAQNPCIFQENGIFYRKENAYVFDFDPARTLTIFEAFANDLSSDTTNSRGDMDVRKNHVRELLNFFPVIGEDENGEMIELDAEKVLLIPRKIRSWEVVRRGFMSNYLFQNIHNIFSAPNEVLEIIQKMTPAPEPLPINSHTREELSINPETGEVDLPSEQVIGTATEVFGEKIYDQFDESLIKEKVNDAFEQVPPEKKQSFFDDFKKRVKSEIGEKIVDVAKEKYGKDLRSSDTKKIKKQIQDKIDRQLDQVYNAYQIDQKLAEKSRLEAFQTRDQTGKTTAEIEAEYEEKKKELQENLKTQLSDKVSELVQSLPVEVVETVEKKKNEREKETIEDAIRDRLRGFARTIPSFLMAYGDETVTLATFDKIIPDQVFQDVTSITLDQFRFLRDGGSYTDEETGEQKEFPGHLFDPVVFDDSVKEFLRLKKTLADYFTEEKEEDIFDYIPPQRTNQIFTPKEIVKKMVDLLEKENPGCFDDPQKTFIDPYMKSGLYIAEIIKRLYKSESMKKLFPDSDERLQHIFEKQVYGLAPTEIIYRIAIAYILGFDENGKIQNHHFKQLDALPLVKEETLSQELDRLF